MPPGCVTHALVAPTQFVLYTAHLLQARPLRRYVAASAAVSALQARAGFPC